MFKFKRGLAVMLTTALCSVGGSFAASPRIEEKGSSVVAEVAKLPFRVVGASFEASPKKVAGHVIGSVAVPVVLVGAAYVGSKHYLSKVGKDGIYSDPIAQGLSAFCGVLEGPAQSAYDAFTSAQKYVADRLKGAVAEAKGLSETVMSMTADQFKSFVGLLNKSFKSVVAKLKGREQLNASDIKCVRKVIVHDCPNVRV